MVRYRLVFLSFFFLLVSGCALITPDLSAAQVEKKYTNAFSKFVDVDGLRVHYRDQGRGPALVLLHGSNASLHTWEGWVRELSENFRIISLDLPGHGLTGPDDKQRYDWVSMAQVVDGLMLKIGISKFSIVGNSMGGAVAWNYALLYPEKVQKLILIGSRGYPSEEPKPLIFRAYATPGLGHLMTVITPRYAVEKSILDLYGDSSIVTKNLVDLYHDLLLREGNREATRLRFSHPSEDRLLDKITTINIPTLVMWGSEDRWILPKYANKFVADIKGAKLKIYGGLGHVPMEEAPGVTAKDAQEFLLAFN